MLASLLSAILAYGSEFFLIFAAVFAITFAVFRNIWSERSSFEWAEEIFEKHSSVYAYIRILSGLLDLIDNFFGRRECWVRLYLDNRRMKAQLPDKDDYHVWLENRNQYRSTMLSNKKPWSWGLFEFLLLLAIAYPIGALCIQWAITGDEAKVGTLVILNKEPDLENRAIPFGVILMLAVLDILSKRFQQKYQRLLMQAVSGLFVVLFGVTIALEGAGAGAVAGPVVFLVAFVREYMHSISENRRIGMSGLNSITIAVFAALSVSVSAAIPQSTLDSFYYHLLHNNADLIDWSFFIVIFVSIPMGLIAAEINKLRRNFEFSCNLDIRIVLLGLLLFLFSALWISILAPIENNFIDPNHVNSILLFMGFFPIINACADFCSTGLTRWLLRNGSRGNLWAWAPLDLLLGVCTFILLGFLMIIVAELLPCNSQS